MNVLLTPPAVQPPVLEGSTNPTVQPLVLGRGEKGEETGYAVTAKACAVTAKVLAMTEKALAMTEKALAIDGEGLGDDGGPWR
jgi:hypothetical protein